jgi:hypothetical protein
MNSAEVEHRIGRWANAKLLPPAVAERLLALDEPGRTQLLEIAERLRMRTGQFISAFALLEEIAVRECQSLGEILAHPSVRRVVNSVGSGPGRARALLDELRSLRYPRLKRASESFAEEVAAIKLPPGIKIVLPRDLASDEVRVEIVAHGSAKMAELLRWLSAKSGELVRLAAMLGGADNATKVEMMYKDEV